MRREMQFENACKNNYILDCCAKQNDEEAKDLWQSLTTGIAANQKNSNVLDTIPSNMISVLRTDAVITSAVIGEIWAAYSNEDIKDDFSFREALRKCWKNLEEDQKNRELIEKGFGWDKSTASHILKELQNSNLDTSALVRIAKLASKMYADLKGSTSKDVLNIPATVCSVKNGGIENIAKLLPSELALFCYKDTESLILYRLATEKATVYQTKGSEKKSRGRLIVAIDESSSMHGIREEYCAACCIALSRVAIEQKRPVSVIHFSTSVIVQDLNPNDPKDIVKLIRKELDGGTIIHRALDAATEKVGEYKNSDVIFITDGVDFSKEIKASVEKLTNVANLYTVAIQCQIKTDAEAIGIEKNASALRDKAKEYIHLSTKDVKEGNGTSVLTGAFK